MTSPTSGEAWSTSVNAGTETTKINPQRPPNNVARNAWRDLVLTGMPFPTMTILLIDTDRTKSGLVRLRFKFWEAAAVTSGGVGILARAALQHQDQLPQQLGIKMLPHLFMHHTRGGK